MWTTAVTTSAGAGTERPLGTEPFLVNWWAAVRRATPSTRRVPFANDGAAHLALVIDAGLQGL